MYRKPPPRPEAASASTSTTGTTHAAEEPPPALPEAGVLLPEATLLVSAKPCSAASAAEGVWRVGGGGGGGVMGGGNGGGKLATGILPVTVGADWTAGPREEAEGAMAGRPRTDAVMGPASAMACRRRLPNDGRMPETSSASGLLAYNAGEHCSWQPTLRLTHCNDVELQALCVSCP